MKPSRLPSFLAGAGLIFGLVLALPAQEPASTTPPPPPPDEVATPPPPAPTPDPEPAEEEELRRLDEPETAADATEAVEAADAPEAPQAPDAPEADEATTGEDAAPQDRRVGEVVRIGSDALLPAGEEASEVVAIMGNVIADGRVRGASVAVLGDNTTNNGAHEVVAVLGNVHVDGEVFGQVVAVMGSVQLGPRAIVHGEIVSVGGEVTRAPGAVVHGPVHQVGPLPVVGDGLQGLRTWFRTCLLLARPLAFHRDVLWAWGVAAAFAGCYLLLALLFNRSLIVCAQTLERQPGMTIIAAIVASLLAPVLVLLLSIIGVGLLLVPILFLVGLYGKAAFLTWLGRRATLPLGWGHAFPAVFIGVIVLFLLYTIPFAGFLIMKVTSGLGFGMAIYAGLLAVRRPPAPPAAPVPGTPTPIPPAATAAAAPTAPTTSYGVASPALGSVPGAATTGPAPAVPPPMVPPPMPAVVPTQLSTLPRAGFWIRIAASLLDLILVVVVLNFINLEDAWPVLLGVYSAVLWALRGTSIGGIICGLKVVRLDDRKLDWPAAVVRTLGAYLSAVVLGLGFIWVAFDPERQSWHDKIAGTTIVRMPKGVALV